MVQHEAMEVEQGQRGFVATYMLRQSLVDAVEENLPCRFILFLLGFAHLLPK
jgi:hypothetical protein